VDGPGLAPHEAVSFDHERRAIAAFCGRLREAVRATRLAVWTLAPRSLVVSLDDGPADAPAALGTVPIRYGADQIGELTWAPLGAPARPDDTVLMALAADLLGPFLAALCSAPPSESAPPAFGLVGVSDAMAQLRGGLTRAAGAPFPILIEGESGVGKELVARAVHAASGRRGPFVAVNCAALAEDLLDAELFGHARGAFTGAAVERRGLFEEAHGGTFFLDEVAELSARGQAKLLRVLQEGELRRLGENAARRIDVRLVAASNRPLHGEVLADRFRADLRFRLDVVRLRVPPLRERREDIAVLAAHFWQAIAADTGTRAQLAPSLLASLSAYEWPGNARELQNAVAAIAVHAPRRGLVRAADLPPLWGVAAAPAPASLASARRSFEITFVRAALARCGQRPAVTARELGVTRQGLAKLMIRLGVHASRPPLSRAM
jgi:two-component system response regulator HydG